MTENRRSQQQTSLAVAYDIEKAVLERDRKIKRTRLW